jgi:hypothetical protein
MVKPMNDVGERGVAAAQLARAESLGQEMRRQARGGAVPYLVVGLALGAVTFTGGYLAPRSVLGVPGFLLVFVAALLVALAIGVYGQLRQTVRVPARPLLVVLAVSGGALTTLMPGVAAVLGRPHSALLWGLLSVLPVLPLLAAAWLERKR